MVKRQMVSSGARWESLVGYSRAVCVGQWVSVAGTTAAAVDGGAVGGDDIGGEAREALRRIQLALEQAAARLEDVVRTRMFVTDVRRWEEAGRAHGEVFAEIRPATSMVEVSKLIDPALLVEIEADGGGAIARRHPGETGARTEATDTCEDRPAPSNSSGGVASA